MISLQSKQNFFYKSKTTSWVNLIRTWQVKKIMRLVLLCVVVAASARELPQAENAEDLPLAIAGEELPVGKVS